MSIPETNLDEILKVIQIVNIVFPHLTKLLTVVRTPTGINVTLQATTTEEGFRRTAELVEKWQSEGG